MSAEGEQANRLTGTPQRYDQFSVQVEPAIDGIPFRACAFVGGGLEIWDLYGLAGQGPLGSAAGAHRQRPHGLERTAIAAYGDNPGRVAVAQHQVRHGGIAESLRGLDDGVEYR